MSTLHRLGASLDCCTLDGASPSFIAAQEGKTEALHGRVFMFIYLFIYKERDCNCSILRYCRMHIFSLLSLSLSLLLYIKLSFNIYILYNNTVLGLLGADLNKQDDDGASPLCIATQEGQLDAMQVLINFNCNLNNTTKDGATPGVYLSMSSTCLYVLKCLIMLLTCYKNNNKFFFLILYYSYYYYFITPSSLYL